MSWTKLKYIYIYIFISGFILLSDKKKFRWKCIGLMPLHYKLDVIFRFSFWKCVWCVYGVCMCVCLCECLSAYIYTKYIASIENCWLMFVPQKSISLVIYWLTLKFQFRAKNFFFLLRGSSTYLYRKKNFFILLFYKIYKFYCKLYMEY